MVGSEVGGGVVCLRENLVNSGENCVGLRLAEGRNKVTGGKEEGEVVKASLVDRSETCSSDGLSERVEGLEAGEGRRLLPSTLPMNDRIGRLEAGKSTNESPCTLPLEVELASDG